MSVDRDTLNAVITENVNKNCETGPSQMHSERMGIVRALRAAFADIEPVRQYGLLLQLLTVANAPGFSRESFTAALNFLREGQRYGVPPSEWGAKGDYAGERP